MSAYVPPSYNAVNADLKPVGSDPVTLPAFNAVNADLGYDPTTGDGSAPSPGVSDNARRRNFAILLAV